MLNNKYFKADLGGQTGQSGSKGLADKIEADLQQILDTHMPEPLSDPIREQVDAIMRKFAAD